MARFGLGWNLDGNTAEMYATTKRSMFVGLIENCGDLSELVKERPIRYTDLNVYWYDFDSDERDIDDIEESEIDRKELTEFINEFNNFVKEWVGDNRDGESSYFSEN